MDLTLDSQHRSKGPGDGGSGFADGSDGFVVCAYRRRTPKCDSDRDDESVRKHVLSTLSKTRCSPFRSRRLFCVTSMVRYAHEFWTFQIPQLDKHIINLET